ncbi:cilia- and flagella-associated protein 54-like isoform X3 [Lineus longissimus]|uniref:cilia- and flagella-associated protein 54-like isoform X3 n=1 Tax=Lineus longissimus TaxID=88925 RepID=UPI00315C7266
MSGTLKYKAAAAVNRGRPSTFYSKDKPNPVFQALEQEIKVYIGYMRKRSTPWLRTDTDEASSRPADTLFELWNKYEPRLPELYYQDKLLEMGDFLVSIKEYNLALWQCYGRYLKHFGDVNVEEITDVDDFKKTFFPDGFEMQNSGFTFRALMGKAICMYQAIKMTDPKLQNKESVDRCIQLLSFLRLVMQVVLPQEKLCWLVYNGTIHIYSVSRHLMSLGHSSRVVEYLLWASMCMESSVPLLGIKYLVWRSTLYTAVCQCYFDCKAGQHAEAFARRGLAKINELSQLENISSSPQSVLREVSFRTATIKMAIMVYKRSVFESRRKPKGLLRPKTRANLKDAQGLPWPRTPSEKLLVDMFEGSAAQFLGILETLSDSNRRTVQSAPPASDSEVEILDVYAELFMAAQEILSGGGGNTSIQQNTKSEPSLFEYSGLAGVVDGPRTLMDYAAAGEDAVPLSAVIKLIKFAYCFEYFDLFDVYVDNILAYLKEVDDPRFGPDIKILELLLAMERVSTNRRSRKQTLGEDGSALQDKEAKDKENRENKEKEQPPAAMSSISDQRTLATRQTFGRVTSRTLTVCATTKSSLLNDDLIQLAEVLLSISSGPYSMAEMDMDSVMDAVVFLWNKAKAVLQKYQTGSIDNARYLQKMENPSKWVYILHIVHQVMGWCNFSTVDPALSAEVAIRLALVLESSATIDESKNRKVKIVTKSETPSAKGDKGKDTKDTDSVTSREMPPPSQPSRAPSFTVSILKQGPKEQLLQAREILELGLKNVSQARQAVALTDGKSIADIGWVKELNEDLFKPEEEGKTSTLAEESGDADMMKSGDATAVWNMVRDLHLELEYMYHRVCLKLAAMSRDPSKKARKSVSTASRLSEVAADQIKIESDEELSTRCNKNLISKCLLNMQKALLSSNDGLPSVEQKQLMQEALTMLSKSQNEEKRLFIENTSEMSQRASNGPVPPPPILLCRTDTSMVFRPAPFNPKSDKIAWYRIFCRAARGSNVKVRLNDYYLPGTGQEVPSFRCELRVSGLIPSERYVFAVAAYTAEGKLIGDGIGETSKPILAAHPIPVLMTWAYLSQVAYQVGCYDIALEACSVLWSHFVATPPPPSGVTYTEKNKKDFVLSLHRLNKKVVSLASPVLLRQFLTSIFLNVDIHVKEGALFCDTLCDHGPLYNGQVYRLLECERMLVAIELGGWLNEANLALQAVVQCYGLLAPMIHFKIPSPSAIQVLERCHVVLQEIPVALRQRRQSNISESIHHMTACLTFHMAKVLRTWGQKAVAHNLNETGRKLLAIDTSDPKADGKDSKDKLNASATDFSSLDQVTDSGALTLAALKKRRTKAKVLGSKEEPDGPVNEELKALEAHMLRLSKQGQGEHELTGNEDPNILHAYIAYLPSRVAYREVVKFKRRTRYLEFFVQVVQKALAEGIAEQAMEWCEDTAQWINKRNEQIIGNKAIVVKQPGALTVAGDDPKKFAAAMVEYSKEKSRQDQTPRFKALAPTGKPKPRKPGKGMQTKFWKGRLNQGSEPVNSTLEEALNRAFDVMSLYLPDLIRTAHRRRKLRRICTEELPWRSQLNILLGLSQFGTFLHRLELMEKLMGSNTIYRTTFLDQEWFTLETSGTLVVNWDGGPSRQVTRQGGRQHEGREPPNILGRDETPRATGIELAAAAATGNPPPPLFPVPEVEEDTPRTYRSDASSQPRQKPTDPKVEDSSLVNPKMALDMLTKTFQFFKRAIVLAHRGQHWTLLQNSCRALWNCAHTALLRACISTNNPGGMVTAGDLREMAWLPFYTAADCLLDMLSQLLTEINSEINRARNKGRPVPAFDTWMGTVKDEKGAASLKFETRLDDISTVDTRWVRRIVLRTLEILYYEHKWEKLVHVALKFNALTNDRYAEQVNPLLVQAQRKLTVQLEDAGGELPPQEHYRVAEDEIGGRVTAHKYTNLQLKLNVALDQLSEIDPGAHIDPEGHDAYSGGTHAMKNISVPLDVEASLDSLRVALDASQYTARALFHSRKLMVLYLAGQQNVPSTDMVGGGKSITHIEPRVEFRTPLTARPQLTMPPDLSKEEYRQMDDVQVSPLPKSQLHIVVSSYVKTIELLTAKNQKGTAGQAMRELANLYYHSGNIKAAYTWWSNSLDVILNTTDAIRNWRSQMKPGIDISRELLDRCGLWGCILGGVVASNIAQFVLTSDLGLRMECCFLSGFFFKALFRSSMPHPLADRDYALYDIGEGAEVTNLVPGMDLLSERFRSDGRTLIAALRWVTEELARGKQNLFVLPLLTLYSYFTTFMCRDLQRSVDGRILKVRVLTDLGLLTEAYVTLQRLLHGERLPHNADSNFRQTESRSSSVKFNTSKPIMDPNNLKILESVIDKRLSSSLGSLYGPHLTCHLSLAQAHLLIATSGTIPVIPEVLDEPTTSGESEAGVEGKDKSILVSNVAIKGSRYSKASSMSKIGFKEDADSDADTISDPAAHKRFSSARRPVSLEIVKGTVLAAAESMLRTVSELILVNAAHDSGEVMPGQPVDSDYLCIDNLQAAELELVVLCKLELAAIGQQKHHAAMAARTVLSALKMMQNSQIFKEGNQKDTETAPPKRPSSFTGTRDNRAHLKMPNVRLTKPEGNQFQYQNFQARSRLDCRLWLDCRLALVKSLVGEIRGMGEVRGPEREVKVELADCREYCKEGVIEAEDLGDIEMMAEFLVQGALLDILEGKTVDRTRMILEEVLRSLDSVPCLSMPGQLIKTTAMMQLTDLHAAEKRDEGDEGKPITETTLREYIKAQTLLLDQMKLLGEEIEYHYADEVTGLHLLATPVSPIHNLYLPHLLPLTQVKLRIGHAVARNAARFATASPKETSSDLWVSALGILNTALELSKVNSRRQANLEADILLTIGKVQRQLFNLGHFHPRAVVGTLLTTIRTSFLNDHDLGLIRQAYLEMALVYLVSSGMVPALREESAISLDYVSDAGSGDDLSVRGGSPTRRRAKKYPSKKDLRKKKEEQLSDVEKDRRAAWIAIRCAASAGSAQRSRMLLMGNTAVTTQALSAQARNDIPDFAVLDLIGSYVLGEKKRIFKDAIEEALANMPEAQEQQKVETYEEQIERAKRSAEDVSWVHLLGYQSLLQRICNTSTVSITADRKKKAENEDGNLGDLGPEFDLGFIAHSQFDTSINHDVIRSPLYSGVWATRLNHMHNFFSHNLPVYAESCCAIYPPAMVDLPVPDGALITDIHVTTKMYEDNRITSFEIPPGGSVSDVALPPGTREDDCKPVDKPLVQPTTPELCLQWYQPSLQEVETMNTETGKMEQNIVLCYAINKKAERASGSAATGMQCSMIWVSLAQLMDLHDRLSVLTQRGEISLLDKPTPTKKEPSQTPTPTTSKQKKAARIKALSPKVKKDVHLEALLKQCMNDAQKLFGVILETIEDRVSPTVSPTTGAPTLTTAAASETEHKSAIPFDVNKTNVYNFERLFDPSFGLILKGSDLLQWLLKLFPIP